MILLRIMLILLRILVLLHLVMQSMGFLRKRLLITLGAIIGIGPTQIQPVRSPSASMIVPAEVFRPGPLDLRPDQARGDLRRLLFHELELRQRRRDAVVCHGAGSGDGLAGFVHVVVAIEDGSARGRSFVAGAGGVIELALVLYARRLLLLVILRRGSIAIVRHGWCGMRGRGKPNRGGKD